MLTALELVNFKGISERQRIELRPITLIFGPNSAGKSTLLQALIFLHEVLTHGKADVGRTSLGGQAIDLGGFQRLVHKHDIDRTMTLRVEFTSLGRLDRFDRELTDFPLPNLEDELRSTWLEVSVCWKASTEFTGPVVERATWGAAGSDDPLVWTELTEGPHTQGRDGILNARINLRHSLLAGEGEDAQHALDLWQEQSWPDDWYYVNASGFGGGQGSGAGFGDGSGYGDGRAIPTFALVRSRYSALPSPREPLRIVPANDSLEARVAAEQARMLLEMIVCGTSVQLLDELQSTLYLGPLRSIPERGFLYEHAGRNSTWASGLGAWDALMADPTSLVEATNSWLRRLGAGCSVVREHLTATKQVNRAAVEAQSLPIPPRSKSRKRTPSPKKRQSSTGASTAEAPPLVTDSIPPLAGTHRLLLRTSNGALVFPSELGAGISQVLPVVVAAVSPEYRLCMIEQPELHVHPALQVGLGDLVIQAVAEARGRRAFLIETHSEHLILRLLKRIRQSTERELPEGAHGLDADQLSVIYVDSVGGETCIRRLEVDDQGEFVDRWPRGFFSERMEELL